MGERAAVRDRGYADGQHRNAERLPVERGARVVHARAGDDAGVGKLHGAHQAAEAAGRERVDGDDRTGTHMVEHAPDDLAGLDARLTEHARREYAYRPPGCEKFGRAGDEVPRRDHMVGRARTDRVRRDRAAAESCDEHGGGAVQRRQQRFDECGEHAHAARKRLLLAPRKRLERQGKIAAAGLSEQPRGPFGRDLGLVDVQTLALIFALADAGKLVPAAQIFQQLDRKIGPVCHKITPFRGVCGGLKKICIFLEKMLAIFEV